MTATTAAAAAYEQCPVCPNAGLLASDLRCPTCGSDLTVLRRVQELPRVLCNDALALLVGGHVEQGSDLLAAAAVFDQTRAAVAQVRDLLATPEV